ncbi:hypothetical protein AX774_g5265 [Zancudomyces culisetae]|uniref:Pentatricopeptide repeat-containing protein n=1 Tax=Zancudomyces culisetae TaxID=1213189 RepID=A0A1R1PK09_ZANCU|nr:hypothetical protein AX774_g5265 [Zancudomyces culisetae]|eukprot:OMH81277.1 hypothetical protein AX774_g5265 [Zancudomyces culisetae]
MQRTINDILKRGDSRLLIEICHKIKDQNGFLLDPRIFELILVSLRVFFLNDLSISIWNHQRRQENYRSTVRIEREIIRAYIKVNKIKEAIKEFSIAKRLFGDNVEDLYSLTACMTTCLIKAKCTDLAQMIAEDYFENLTIKKGSKEIDLKKLSVFVKWVMEKKNVSYAEYLVNFMENRLKLQPEFHPYVYIVKYYAQAGDFGMLNKKLHEMKTKSVRINEIIASSILHGIGHCRDDTSFHLFLMFIIDNKKHIQLDMPLVKCIFDCARRIGHIDYALKWYRALRKITFSDFDYEKHLKYEPPTFLLDEKRLIMAIHENDSESIVTNTNPKDSKLPDPEIFLTQFQRRGDIGLTPHFPAFIARTISTFYHLCDQKSIQPLLSDVWSELVHLQNLFPSFRVDNSYYFIYCISLSDLNALHLHFNSVVELMNCHSVFFTGRQKKALYKRLKRQQQEQQ